MIKHTLKYIQKQIRKRGGRLLSSEYKNNKSKIFIQCGKKHIWQTTWGTIQKGHWCPECADTAPSIEEVRKVVAKKGGKLLSKSYRNAKTKLKVRCERCQSVWNPTMDAIRKGHWCPRCSSGKGQRKLAEILEEIYHCEVKINFRDFDWLKNEKTKGIQELDAFLPSIKLAVEYDGIQHFQPVRWGNISQARAEEKFRKTKKRDARKNRLVRKNKADVKYFLRVKYTTDLTIENIKRELRKKGIPYGTLRGRNKAWK